MASKRCIHCGEDKPLSQFNRKPSNKDNRDNRCKSCMSALNKRINGGKRKAMDKPNGDGFLFQGCGVCQKPMRSPWRGLWLCANHRPNGNRRNSVENGHCDRCPQLQKCRARVRLGIWVYCERPTEQDLRWERMQTQERLAEAVKA